MPRDEFGAASLITMQAALSSITPTPAPISSAEPQVADSVVKNFRSNVLDLREAPFTKHVVKGKLSRSDVTGVTLCLQSKSSYTVYLFLAVTSSPCVNPTVHVPTGYSDTQFSFLCSPTGVLAQLW